MLLEQPNFLVLDEPTNHLDLQTKEMMKSLLADFDGSILLVSHDRDLLDAVCTDFWCLHDEQLTFEMSLEASVRKILG